MFYCHEKFNQTTFKFIRDIFCFAYTQFTLQPFTQLVQNSEKSGYCDYCHLDDFNSASPNGPLPYICPVSDCKNRIHSITTGRCIDCNHKMKDWVDPVLKSCTGCRMVYYCSSPCQKAAWKSYHDKECRFLKNWTKNHSICGSYPKGEFIYKSLSF